jgi:exosortase
MKFLRQLSVPRLAVFCSALFLLSIWLVLNFPRIGLTQNGIIRLSLGVFFASVILFRRKAEDAEPPFPSWAVPLAVVAGIFCIVNGIIFDIHQFKWLGIMLILFACLAWALPQNFGKDILLALFVFYWVHPLPNQVFGPVQLAMQKMSVAGAGWLLHILNVHVWADGFVLKTGGNTYEVPEWCSGMRTATTVFLLGLGMGITRRLRWYETVVVVFAALVQALILNIIRLSAMVVMAPRIGEGSGLAFLHDTTGIIVLAAVLLLYFEILLWERIKRERISLGHYLLQEYKKAFSAHPPFWRVAFKHKWAITVSAVIVAVGALSIYKSRPYHRAEMMKDVATALRDSGKLEDAERLANLICRMQPRDLDWKLTAIRVVLIRQKYDQVLAELRSIPDDDPAVAMEKKVLKAYSFMGLKRMEEANAIVAGLPESVKQTDSRVAMILAELGLRADDPDEIARNIVVASRWNPNTSRVRAMYPYLRNHRCWNSIIDSDRGAPYGDPVQALSATEAYMNLDKVPLVANLALKEMAQWPDDPRVLEPLFYMALRRESSVWEDRLAEHLVRCARTMSNPDALYELFGKCFQLNRPDLAWFVHRRIKELDPSHPALSMSIAVFGDSWFVFRRQYLGFNSPLPTERIDLKPLFALGRSIDSWRTVCGKVPAGEELCVPDTIPVRKKRLRTAIAEFKKRDANDQVSSPPAIDQSNPPVGSESASAGVPHGLSVPMRYLYVLALEMEGDVQAACDQLQKIVIHNPEEKEKARLILSEVFERKARWPEVYETLKGYAEEPEANFTPLLRLCEAQLQLHLGLAALDTAQTAVRLFPGSTQAASILSTALMTYDSPEEALFVLSQPRNRRERDLDMLEAECLFLTERFSEIESFCHSVQLPAIRVPPGTKQEIHLPPAEAAAMWHWLSVPSDKDFENTAKVMRQNLATATSPFLHDIMRLWLDCYGSKCHGESAEPRRWLACGRDTTEKAIALSQLTLFLCWQEKYAEARHVAGMAVAYLPQSPILWRTLISLSGSDLSVISAARKECPADSEIWLAELVARTQVGGNEEWLANEVRRAAESKAFTPAAMTRAAEYLLRGGRTKAAAVVARDAVNRARGLLSPYVIGVRCALIENDKEWTLECARGAIKAALQPLPIFYQKLVELKGDRNKLETDTEMLEVLRRLRTEEPDKPIWAQMLGYVRFARGGWETVEAFEQMDSAIQAGVTNKTAYIVAAEASRLAGNSPRAADILKKALEHYPDDTRILNNLAYTLCFTPEGASEALKLLPRLLKGNENDISVQDTVSLVYLHAGKIDDAEKVAGRILKKVKQETPEWFRARMRLAEVAIARNNRPEAATILTDVLKHTHGVPDEDVLAASGLLSKTVTPVTNKPPVR